MPGLRRIYGMKRCLGLLLLALALTACAGGRPAAQNSPAFAIQDNAQATRWVDTHGIEVAVPAVWRLGRGVCGTPKENTVLWDEDGVPACLANQPPALSAVIFGGSFRRLHGFLRHTTPVSIHGVPARRWAARTVSGSREVRLDFVSRNFSVTVLSPHHSLLRRILASVRPIRVDLNGCPTHPTAGYRRGSKRNAWQPFVPTGARRMIGCSYQGRWLDHSNLVGPAAARKLGHALDAAPFGFDHAPRNTILSSVCSSTWRGSSITARFEYVAHRPVTVSAHLIGCSRLGASNGSWGVRLKPWWVGLITSDARYSGAMVDLHNVG